MFSRSDVTLMRPTDGAGIGLSLCARLATLMGGYLKIQSEFGVGTNASLFLDIPVTQFDDDFAVEELIDKHEILPFGTTVSSSFSEKDSFANVICDPKAFSVGLYVLVAEDNPV